MVITKAFAVTAALVTMTAVITATATIIIQRPAIEQQVIAAPVPARRTVTYFRAHKDEMRAKLAFCNDNPGRAPSDPECEAAATVIMGF